MMLWRLLIHVAGVALVVVEAIIHVAGVALDVVEDIIHVRGLQWILWRL